MRLDRKYAEYEKTCLHGSEWIVRTPTQTEQDVFETLVVRANPEIRSEVIGHLDFGDIVVQSGNPKVQSDILRIEIEGCGWISVSAKAIGGPTFLKIHKVKVQKIYNFISHKHFFGTQF